MTNCRNCFVFAKHVAIQKHIKLRMYRYTRGCHHPMSDIEKESQVYRLSSSGNDYDKNMTMRVT